MKQVFKCDYCSEMGTEEEIAKHEIVCTDNYDRKNCYTCTHKKIRSNNSKWYYECALEKEIPEGKIIEFCPSYERKENAGSIFSTLFGDLF